LSVSFIGLVGLNKMLEKRERKKLRERKNCKKTRPTFIINSLGKEKKSFLHFQTLGFFYIRLLVENSLLLFFA
jgi:hypothetical protein